jgi:hypothetical protein
MGESKMCDYIITVDEKKSDVTFNTELGYIYKYVYMGVDTFTNSNSCVFATEQTLSMDELMERFQGTKGIISVTGTLKAL